MKRLRRRAYSIRFHDVEKGPLTRPVLLLKQGVLWEGPVDVPLYLTATGGYRM